MKSYIEHTQTHGKSKPQLEAIAAQLTRDFAAEYGVKVIGPRSNGIDTVYDVEGDTIATTGLTGKLLIGSWFVTVQLRLPLFLSVSGEAIEQSVQEALAKALA